MSMPMQGPRLARPKEAAKHAKCGLSVLYRLIREGKIVAYKNGGATLIDLDSVDAYLRSLPRIAPTAKP